MNTYSTRKAARRSARIRFLACTLAPVLLAVSAPSPAAHPALPPKWTDLVKEFDPTLAEYAIVGGSIALIEDGRVVARHDYGFADKSKGRKVDGDTIFHWASITKTLNAITVMRMRDEGKLTLSDPIVRYVPELRRLHNPYNSMDAISIRMLLDHSAGFQGPTWPYKGGAYWEPFEPTEWSQLVAMMPYQTIAFQPGTRFSYSNPAWIYLAHMVEQMTDDPWQYYVEKTIFAPLGMTRSYTGYTPAYLAEHRSSRYMVQKDAKGQVVTEDLGGEFDPGITIPNGGWNSPLADAAAYVAFLTDATHGDPALRARYDSVLAHSTLEEMWRPQLPVDDSPEGEKMGLGFFIIEGKTGSRVVGHTGGQAGFTSFLYFNPATRRGVVAAFNTANLIESPEKPGYFSILKRAAIEMLQ